MSERFAERNFDARVVRPMAIRLARLIELMSRYWVDPELAAADAKERRLAITKAYLVNSLGLQMLVDTRYTAGHVEKQIHHLPRQDARVVEAAVQFLSEHELQHGVAEALRALVSSHPYPDGAIPAKPDFSLDEVRARGFKRQRAESGNLKQEALRLISERWISNKEWSEHSGSTRLAEYIRQIREDDGLDVSIEYRKSESDTNQTYAYYRFIKDDAERAAWNQEQAVKEFMRTEALAEQGRVDARAKLEARLAARRQKISPASSFTQRYGGWKKPIEREAAVPGKPMTLFKAPEAPLVRTAPGAGIMSRLQGLQQRVSKPEEVSAPGIPAAELNRLKPNAASRDVVECDGQRYIRNFLPGNRDLAGKVISWNAEWVALSGPRSQ